MAREPKPYYRKVQKRWVCTIQGRRITLGKTKTEAMKKFHELMACPPSLPAEVHTLYGLSQVYLDWVVDNRKAGTYDKHKHYLEDFIGHVGRMMKVGDLLPSHMTAWTKQPSWNSTTRSDAIGVVHRMLTWAIEDGHLRFNPIAGIRKPTRRRRDIVYTVEQWEEIKQHANPSVLPILSFLWLTGCRPIEARTLEDRHIHDDLVIFPPDESKGERDSRVIFLTEEAKAVLEPLRGNGILFRNSRNAPWTKNALVHAMARISSKVGFRVIAYGARHSYATNSLIRSVDAVSLAHLMGHKDTRVIASHYAHLSHNLEHLRKQARTAAGVPEQAG